MQQLIQIIKNIYATATGASSVASVMKSFHDTVEKLDQVRQRELSCACAEQVKIDQANAKRAKALAEADAALAVSAKISKLIEA